MSTRLETLSSLLEFTKPIEEIERELKAFEWDSDELIDVSVFHIRTLLQAYVSDEIAAAEVERWANAVECRDDIGITNVGSDTITESIFELANPLLFKPLTKHRASELIQLLETALK